jgi:NitT/TauT family transport system ATP-binding protein
LLKLAAGLLQPQAGQVLLNGQAVTRPNKRVGFVFQTPTLLEWLTVLDNVLLPATLRRTSDPTYRTRAFDLLHAVGLSAYAHQYPHQLSGGQQSRVALARALILEPLMLLLDEPFAALDAMTREELQSLLLHVCDNHQVTVMFVTHDIAEAVFLADRVAVMAEGQLLENFEIAIPKPRRLCMRYSHEFNRLCESLRLTMDGSP